MELAQFAHAMTQLGSTALDALEPAMVLAQHAHHVALASIKTIHVVGQLTQLAQHAQGTELVTTATLAVREQIQELPQPAQPLAPLASIFLAAAWERVVQVAKLVQGVLTTTLAITAGAAVEPPVRELRQYAQLAPVAIILSVAWATAMGHVRRATATAHLDLIPSDVLQLPMEFAQHVRHVPTASTTAAAGEVRMGLVLHVHAGAHRDIIA